MGLYPVRRVNSSITSLIPEVYQTAAALLGLSPNEVMMVAAHPGDLRASQAVGFQTALVPRPLEYGPGRVQGVNAHPSDLVASDFNELADLLGIA